MKVSRTGVEEYPSYSCKNRIAYITVLPRHGSFLNASLEPITHDQVITRTKLLDKVIEILEVVAVVGVSHDAIAAIGGFYCAVERRAISTHRNRNDPRSKARRDLLGTIRGTVIADYNLSADSRPLNIALRLADADCDGFRLVEAGHYNAEFHSHIALFKLREIPTLPEDACLRILILVGINFFGANYVILLLSISNCKTNTTFSVQNRAIPSLPGFDHAIEHLHR